VNKWNDRFMSLAILVGSWSKDPSTKVGSVIVDHQRRVVAVGYNGFPRNVEDTAERHNDKPTKYKLIVHAEANAILNANKSVERCVLYATRPPCSECTKLIIQSGITDIYCPQPVVREQMPGDRNWNADWLHSSIMLQEANVAVNFWSPS
jgi:dCMP deaminase